MHIARLEAEKAPSFKLDEAVKALMNLLGVLRLSGRLLGREFPIVDQERILEAFLMMPEWSSLAGVLTLSEPAKWIGRMRDAGLMAPTITVLGEDPASTGPCRCPLSASLILFTTHVAIESPLRCGECFLPVPLYRIPPISADENYWDVVSWQSTYQACDQLWMSSGALEREAYDQLCSVNSDLSREGMAVARNIEARTGTATFYRVACDSYSEDAGAEGHRDHCPWCGAYWRLDQLWHGQFRYRCSKCRLVGSLA